MQIFYDLEELKGVSIGLGFFDGVHSAHREVIKKTVECACACGVKSAIFTFYKNPLEALSGRKYSYLTTREEKAKLIETLGVDYLFYLDFEKFKHIEAEDFIQDILVKHFEPKCIVTGFNNHFGAGGKGNPELLRQFAEKFNYKYYEMPEIKKDDETISSTLIKKYLEEGKIRTANNLLGRNFKISGSVVAGNRIGRKISYPTANINWEENIVKLPYGVYSGYVNFKGQKYLSVINWGMRPTVDSAEVLEAHILDFDADIYGEKIEIEFLDYVRVSKKFNSLDELKAQIAKDKDYIIKQHSR
ncbi:bifunctional riboflavin kinase/FAD synthetase [bacterium]|nr:bifunctional riboflavin kinase/FAD synthetase [bacterium]